MHAHNTLVDLFRDGERGEIYAAPPASPTTSAFKVLTHRVSLCGLIYVRAEVADTHGAVTCPKCVEQLAQRTERTLEAKAEQATRSNCGLCRGTRVAFTAQGLKPCPECS